MEVEEISKEQVVILKYAPAVREPENKSSEECPDWISSVDASRSFESGAASCVVAACYNGTFQVYSLERTGSLVNLQTVQAHRGSTKSVSQCVLAQHYIASSGTDGEVKLWAIDESKRIGLRARCVGHKHAVESVAVVNVGSHVVLGSGGWDRSVCIWKVNMDETAGHENGSKTIKKRKTNGNTEHLHDLQEVESPSCIMNEHTDSVSSLVWSDEENPVTLYSGSWDHSLKSWDVTRECCTATFNGNKVVTSLSFCPKSQMLASGHADSTVRLWDARAHGDSIVKLELKSVSTISR